MTTTMMMGFCREDAGRPACLRATHPPTHPPLWLRSDCVRSFSKDASLESVMPDGDVVQGRI